MVAEPAEVSSAHSTKEMANHQEGKGQTVGKKKKRLTKEVNTCADISCSTEIGRMRVSWKLRVEVGNDEQVLRDSVLGQNQPKRRMPKMARTVLWEDGG